jgi:hypothetical protein
MFSFDLQEFLKVLENYNQDIWPLQVLAYFLGVIVLLHSFKKGNLSNKFILVILSIFWIWTGLVFSTFYWAPTYEFAYSFSVLFIVQGILFLTALSKSNFSVHFKSNLYSIIGLIFIFYAMFGYQILGYFIGHVYPKYFPFGLVPCPTTIFTIGLFLMANRKIPVYLVIIPLLAALAGIVAVSNGIWEDIGLIVAGLIGAAYLLRKGSKSSMA